MDQDDRQTKSIVRENADINHDLQNGLLNSFKRKVEQLECIIHSRELKYFNLKTSTLKCTGCEYDQIDIDVDQLFQTIMVAQQNQKGYRNEIEKEFRLFKQFIIEELDLLQQSLEEELSELDIEVSRKFTNFSLIELLRKMNKVEDFINKEIKMKKTTQILNLMQKELYNFEQFKWAGNCIKNHQDWKYICSAVQISHNLIITSTENRLYLFRNESTGYQESGSILHKRVWEFKLTSDESLLYMANDDGTVTTIANLKQFIEEQEQLSFKNIAFWIKKIHEQTIKTLDMNQEQNLLITGGEDKILIFWKGENHHWREDWRFDYFDSTISFVRINQTSSVVSVGSFDGTIRFFRQNQEKQFCIDQIFHYNKWIYSVSFSRNFNLIAIGSRTEDIQVLRENEEQKFEIYQILRQQGTVRCVLFLGNALGCTTNQDLLSGCDDQSVRYWRCSVSSFLFYIYISWNLLPMMATGKERRNTPNIKDTEPINLPKNDLGTQSPQPTVVIVIIAHQIAQGYFKFSYHQQILFLQNT